MNILTLENINKSYGAKILFENINFSIHSHDRIGLIGRNGYGKSSLLKIAAGLEKEDDGIITKSSDLRIQYLPQNLKLEEELSVLEAVFTADAPKIKVLREYQKVIAEDEIDAKRLLKLTELMDRDNIWELESEAKKVLTELGIRDFKKKISQLSGGQKRRVALASALITPADLLILDEPTNHLDDESIIWLESYLKSRTGALLMVTHDRYFLDRVTNRIVEIRNKSLYNYDGNYQYYVEKKAQEEEDLLASERKRKSLYKQELAWMKQGIRARGTRQKARVERFEELSKSKIGPEEKDIEINLIGQRLGKKIVEAKNISKSFLDKKIIDNFNYTVLRDDRIGIVGKNGAGKSTLMNILAGRIEPDEGIVDIGETVKIGYFAQESNEMDLNLRAIDYIKESGEYIETSDGVKISASQMMERFLFSPSMQYTPIEKLSGGERRRLYLLKVLMEGPNFLILDEPTNDLDIDSLTVLEDYLEEFNGPVLVVSHDRYLLDKVVDKIFHIDRAKIKEYPGNYSYWRSKITLNEESNEEVIKKKPKERKANRELKFSYNEKREWDTIEEDIANLEDKLEALETDMIKNSTDYVELEKLSKEKFKLEEKLEEKMERWVYLSDLKEKIDNQ